jgi:hypothetical protein
VTDVDPDHIHPDAQIRVQSPDEVHDVDGTWWNNYVTQCKLAGNPLINRIVTVIDDAGQAIRGFERTPAPSPEPAETIPAPADAPVE